jgi:putative ATPase
MTKNLNSPLADRMRPDKLEGFFGQEELVGKNSYLQKAIIGDNVISMIFWGPPGSGKTTLANIIAKQTDSEFIQISAVTGGKKDLLEVVKKALNNQTKNKKTILFIDEIHRWNKAQQDALLPSVEKGIITLIGATTENPSFEVNSALLSRTRVFVLKKLSEADIHKILERALRNYYPKIKIEAGVLKLLSRLSNGDARMALNTLEASANQNQKITAELVKQVLQKTHLMYDKTGEEHYNIISALHKSMRGGDADAALYWLARMLEGGEDPIYIARRLIRFASEDIGLANNTALLVANAVFDACHKLGVPECNVHLAQCVIYLSKSKKDVTAYLAYGRAVQDVQKFGNLPVPLHIRNAPTKLMKDLDYGKGYKYTPLEDSSEQTYFPDELKNRKYLA